MYTATVHYNVCTCIYRTMHSTGYIYIYIYIAIYIVATIAPAAYGAIASG